jgi:hypothetical protein
MDSSHYTCILKSVVSHTVTLAIGYYLGKQSKCTRN